MQHERRAHQERQCPPGEAAAPPNPSRYRFVVLRIRPQHPLVELAQAWTERHSDIMGRLVVDMRSVTPDHVRENGPSRMTLPDHLYFEELRSFSSTRNDARSSKWR